MSSAASILTLQAIQRHANQARRRRPSFNALGAAHQANVVAFISWL
jgi:hypothetical protein